MSSARIAFLTLLLTGHAALAQTNSPASGPSPALSAFAAAALPAVNLGADQRVSEGSAFTVTAYLTHPAATYPVTIPFTVSGTATYPDDHTAKAGTITISAGLTGSVTFNAVADAVVGEANETVVFALGEADNVTPGAWTSSTVTITEQTLPPRASVTVQQGYAYGFDHAAAQTADCKSCHLSDRPAIHLPYPPTLDCDTCHMPSPATFANATLFDHRAVADMACTSCHGGQWLAAAVKPPKHVITNADCDACHATSTWLISSTVTSTTSTSTTSTTASTTTTTLSAATFSRWIRNDGVTVYANAVVTPHTPNRQTSYRWSSADNRLTLSSPYGQAISFAPTNLANGVYPLTLTLSDTKDAAVTATTTTLLKVVDGNAVYIDDRALRNVIPLLPAPTHAAAVTRPGFELEPGVYALASNEFSAVTSIENVAALLDKPLAMPFGNDGEFTRGGVVDLVATQLDTPGAIVPITLFASTPTDAPSTTGTAGALPPLVIALLGADGTWRSFHGDEHNTATLLGTSDPTCRAQHDVASTADDPTNTLCAMLTVQDGGPNDLDGVADGRVQFTAAVGHTLSQPDSPIDGPDAPAATPSSSGGGALSLWTLLFWLTAPLLGRRVNRSSLVDPVRKLR